ncbi:DUF4489 domain-containing protein [Aminipila sp.]|uniref:DUF4489 domain-containing protein n=1 Tax=Aminipila sp. TaxID=2060095 RepID=UPI00289DD3AD|nr:DUF4489 domain-containing protein [Aminipila sp.]
MNSLFKLDINEKNPICNKYYDCNKNCIHPTPGKVFLKHTNNNLIKNQINLTTPPYTQTFNQPIASVTIDTACFCKPKLLINFVGILTTTTKSFLVLTNTFTLFKTCKDSKILQPVATYNFNVINTVASFPNSQTIKFDYSPCDDPCEDCCSYILEFTRVSSIFAGSSGSITINGAFSVLGVDSSS